jgi:paraquat-inducible protein A
MTLTLYGVRNESTVWGGVVTLAKDGDWFIATVVLLASIVIPFFKIVAMFVLTLSIHNNWLIGKRERLYHFVEVVGRWSMLDIFLLAILVSMIKLKGWASVTAGAGSFAFAGVVIFTMLATACMTPELTSEGKKLEH